MGKKLITDSIIIAEMYPNSVKKRAWGLWEIQIKDQEDEDILVTTCKDKCVYYHVEES